MLSERQQRILRIVVDGYLAGGRPVGSRAISQREDVPWSASTVRAELAALEREGYLTHPHTSAGRVPTDSGYRLYVDSIIATEPGPPLPPHEELDLTRIRREVDEAMRETTAALAQITDLVALGMTPPLATAAFVAELAPAVANLHASRSEALYIEGTAHLLSAAHAADLPDAGRLIGALERRADLLGMLRSALGKKSVFIWIGAENPRPELRSVSVIGANYGLGRRNLGSIGVLGPLRMDYETAIASVREAASELSRFFETVYAT
jgi:heat-inducible transcriptional repressor